MFCYVTTSHWEMEFASLAVLFYFVWVWVFPMVFKAFHRSFSLTQKLVLALLGRAVRS